MSGSKLPNATSATVADAKIRDYLLNPNHADNGGKAAFFLRFGFSQSAWHLLQTALPDHPLTNSVAATTPAQWGVMFEIRCNLQSPDGRNPCIQTIWTIEPISPHPEFVTAYPATPSGSGTAATAVA
jgi:hypothetical protein